MAASAVSICNIALSRIGQKPIADLSDPGVAAVICKANYDPARQAMLREFPWAFARKKKKLAALAANPDQWEYDNEFQLPSDCLWVEKVDVSEKDTPWQVEGRKIVTNAGAPLGITYIRDEEDTTLFDSEFVDALADQLAGEIVFGVTKDIRYRDAFYKSAVFKAGKGRSADSQQGTADTTDANDLIDVR